MEGFASIMENKYILGIDGGGTKTDAVLCDLSGHVVARFIGPASSITGQGVEKAREALHAVVAKVLEGMDEKAGVCACYAGISGGGLPANRKVFREILAEVLPDCAFLENGSDAVNVLTAGIGIKDGVIAIAGTGSCIYARTHGELSQVGGWGYLLGDEGSGFDLGRRAIMTALKALDGRGAAQEVLSLCEEKMGMPLRDYISVLYRSDAKTEIASFAPLLLKAAQEGSVAAKAECQAAAAEIAEAILTADRLVGAKCVVTGGSIWKNDYYRGLVQEKLGKEFKMISIDLPPVYGAVLQAAAQAGCKAEASFEKNFRITLMEE